MATTSQYLNIVATMPDGLEKTVLQTILDGGYTSPQKRITRKMLVLSIFKRAQSNLSNSKEDRQIRRAIVKLVDKGIPILSDSGHAGYYLDAENNRETALLELIRRRNAIDAKIKKLYHADASRAVLSELEKASDPVQLSFSEVA